jgi:hypothetical protein
MSSSNIDDFREFCELQAALYVAGQQQLIESVDRCQARATAHGLVAEIGQDAVQLIMATAFGERPGGPPRPRLNSDFAARCREVDERNQKNPAPEHADLEHLSDAAFYDALNAAERQWQKRGGAPQATWDAVQYSLRSEGFKALARNELRLRTLSSRQLKGLIGSLAKAKAEEALLRALVRMLPDGPQGTG